ncbi:MAG TPA: glutamine amidotransferase [Roseiarcus sp.]|jgi:GMP synthase (glutamine-hydrolysing)|nr:glutamine amidotransferase [Roseiarcus sp.]
MSSVALRPTVLIIMHQEHSTPGRVGYALRAMDVRLDIRRPSLGEPLPKSLAEHDGVVVFGGPMGANDECEWMRREIDWLEAPLKEEKPFLGICLGAQMLARALGARVFSYEDKRSEIGYFPIKPNDAGERLCAELFPRCVYQWHSDGFDLPEAAELLATGGQDFPNQAYRYGAAAVGLQFHPEVTYHMMCRWTLKGAERLTRPGAQQRPGHLGGWFQHDGQVAAWLETFLPAWLEKKLGTPAGRVAAGAIGAHPPPRRPLTEDSNPLKAAPPPAAGRISVPELVCDAR